MSHGNTTNFASIAPIWGFLLFIAFCYTNIFATILFFLYLEMTYWSDTLQKHCYHFTRQLHHLCVIKLAYGPLVQPITSHRNGWPKWIFIHVSYQHVMCQLCLTSFLYIASYQWLLWYVSPWTEGNDDRRYTGNGLNLPPHIGDINSTDRTMFHLQVY